MDYEPTKEMTCADYAGSRIFFPHNWSWQAAPRVVVIGYGELLTSELLPAFVVAKMARCLKLNVSEITALQVSVGPFPECFSYVEVLQIIDILYTNLSKQIDEGISWNCYFSVSPVTVTDS